MSDLVDRLLEKDPERRPRTAAEVALALGRMRWGPMATSQGPLAVDIESEDHASRALDPAADSAADSATKGVTAISGSELAVSESAVSEPTVSELAVSETPSAERRHLTVLCCELVSEAGIFRGPWAGGALLGDGAIRGLGSAGGR